MDEEIGQTMIRFPQPIYTDEIKLYGFYAQSDWNVWNFGHHVYFNMELYGCDEYDIEEIHCEEGWYSSKGDCLKAMEFSDSITFTDAIQKCQDVGGNLIEPMNDILMADMTSVIKNYTGNETRFWIGTKHT